MLCRQKNCNRKATTKKYGRYCLMHYKRIKRHGSPEIVKDNWKYKETKCKHCDKEVIAGGFCRNHYYNWYRHKDALYTEKIRNSVNSRGYNKRKSGIPNHRIVMEKTIGRKLKKGEVVPKKHLLFTVK